MFEQAKNSLRTGGELRIVGNRHLGYHLKLKRLFGNCEVVASDRKFVVLSTIR
jgi:16S rRNA (guanine1207-N2)-methyltransferase